MDRQIDRLAGQAELQETALICKNACQRNSICDGDWLQGVEPPRGADGYTCEAIYSAAGGLVMREDGGCHRLRSERGSGGEREKWRSAGCVRHASLLSISTKVLDGSRRQIFFSPLRMRCEGKHSRLNVHFAGETVWALQTTMLLLHFNLRPKISTCHVLTCKHSA